MDVLDHTRSYQLEVTRRCLTSTLLRECVCAFAAKYLSLIPHGEIWSSPASHYYGDALRSLIRHLDSSPGSNPGDALIANLLLSSYEMLEGRSHEHQRHLHGAAALVRMQQIDATSRGIDLASFWIYARHEVTVALQSETPLQLSPEKWNCEWRKDEVNEDVLGNHVVWLAARVIDLTFSPTRSPSIDDNLQDIQNEATTWFDNLPQSFQGVKYGQPDDLGFNKTYFAVSTAGE